ncbi:hypothetical protein TrVE_jg12289 [Triparma verrucosa]|uniref:ABC1 atypical kinase-like domain-containing protein n=1 Tax=Triparma verrucosa TaxID=1606542 RepID=A0A9W7BPV9_9STRA|nr:hypothetical protein TrVE_jg12289 [Triparma verrucosa]
MCGAFQPSYVLHSSPTIRLVNNNNRVGMKTRAPAELARRRSTFMSPLYAIEEPKEDIGMRKSIENTAAASAAAIATAAVNSAVSMRTLSAPSLSKSYVSLDATNATLDTDGLPTVYDKDLIEQYWSSNRNALNGRWAEFVKLSVPFLTRLTTLFITEGAENMGKHVGSLAKQARIILQELGPTFVKAGQMMSVRPDVLPDEALVELAILQDEVEGFETSVAIAQIESELGGELGEFFEEISEEPVAAASLAQVYRAKLRTGETVAVKIQRPNVLSQVSKDLYVLRRAAEVYQGLIDRFAPQQRTDYVALLNEFAVGFYTELDFVNEGRNQERLRNLLLDEKVQGIMVPRVYEQYSTRRILVTEWVDGVKLSTCSENEIAEYTPIAQEAFLVQLLQVGFFHADPHPGNILKLDKVGENGEKIALIDCGLMASIKPEDREIMVSAIIHLANKDFPQLVTDFINLKILPDDCDRAKVVPLMDKALSPYIMGGGAKTYERELRKTYGMDEEGLGGSVGGFQAMTQDALVVLNDIPFSIPAYFAILGRAIVTLEGVALTGNPEYGIIMESYPFIARKLMKEDTPLLQRSLQELLYGDKSGGGVKFSRLIALINSAGGNTADSKEGMIDLDAKFSDGFGLKEGLKFVMGEGGANLRGLLRDEAITVGDLVFRNIIRKQFGEAGRLGPNLPAAISLFLPKPPAINDLTLPFVLPGFTVKLLKVSDFVDAIAPPLSREEELYALSLGDVVGESAPELEQMFRGEGSLGLSSAGIVFDLVREGGLAKAIDVGTVDSELIESIVLSSEGVINSVGGGSRGVREFFDDGVSLLDDHEKKVYDGWVRDLVGEIVKRVETRASSLAA